MPTIPWATPSEGPTARPAEAPVDIMASHFLLRSKRQTVTMLRHAMAVRRTVLSSPGALGVSLVAQPWRREYWTLSAWTDRASLDAFVRHPVHQAAMDTLRSEMLDATFRFWTSPASTLPPSWDDARSVLRQRT